MLIDIAINLNMVSFAFHKFYSIVLIRVYNCNFDFLFKIYMVPLNYQVIWFLNCVIFYLIQYYLVVSREYSLRN